MARGSLVPSAAGCALLDSLDPLGAECARITLSLRSPTSCVALTS